MNTRQPIPESILNRPELELGLGLFYNAYLDLDGERTRSENIEKIPWSKIKEYSDHYDLDYEQSEDLQFYVRAMDNFVINRARSRKTKDG